MEKKRYIGTAEDRINKWMRMCLQWQFDIRRNNERNANHYFTKYHVGKYAKHFFDDLIDAVIDRDYVIAKMNEISEDRMKRDRKLGIKSNKVVLRQSIKPEKKAGYVSKKIKINDNTVVRYVAKNHNKKEDTE